MKLKSSIFLIVIVTFILSLPALAELFSFEEGTKNPFEPKLEISENYLYPGAHANLLIKFNVPSHHYLYRDKFKFEAESLAGISYGEPIYPLAQKKFDKFLNKEKEIYPEGMTIEVPFQISEDVPLGKTEFITYITFQGCSETVCFIPKKNKLTAIIKISQNTNNVTTTAKTSLSFSEKDIAKTIKENLLLAFGLAFLAGILTSLTPCIFPMLPITIGVIGAKNTKSIWQSFLTSLIYVLGIAFTYALLGVIAALTGSLFGSLLQNPYVISFITLIFVLMGLSMFDVFLVQVPSGLQTRLSKLYQQQNKNSYWGVAFMGLISGLIATPCVGPVIVGLLTYVAQTKDIILGFSILFIFALGMGIILILLGTFSNRLINLPKAGAWMETIKQALGLIMFGVALYYLRPLLPAYLFSLILGMLLVFAGTVLGAFMNTEKNNSIGLKFQKSMGILIVTLGIYFFVGGLNQQKTISTSHQAGQSNSSISENYHKSGLSWIDTEAEGLKLAQEQNKLVMIDFYADWCPACIEFDKITYVDPQVVESLHDFVVIKIDATNIDLKMQELFRKYRVIGLPTIVFLDQNGNLLKEHTITGFKKPTEFLKILNKIKDQQV